MRTTILLCFLAASTLAQVPLSKRQQFFQQPAAGGGGGSCTTLSESWGTATAALEPWGGGGGVNDRNWIAGVWIASNNVVDCQITFTNFTKNGNPTDNVTFQIYNDGGDKPGTDVTSGGTTVAATSISTGNYTVSLTMTSKTSGNHYWVVIHRSGASDSSNNFSISQSSDEPYMFIPMFQKSTDGVTWVGLSNQSGWQMSLYHN